MVTETLDEAAMESLILSLSDQIEADHASGRMGRQPTTGKIARWAMRRLVADLKNRGRLETMSAGDDENAKLRALVARLTDKLEDFVREVEDPGADAFAAIYCGRNFIYG
jgi:hypothetical protein